MYGDEWFSISHLRVRRSCDRRRLFICIVQRPGAGTQEWQRENCPSNREIFWNQTHEVTKSYTARGLKWYPERPPRKSVLQTIIVKKLVEIRLTNIKILQSQDRSGTQKDHRENQFCRAIHSPTSSVRKKVENITFFIMTVILSFSLFFTPSSF